MAALLLIDVRPDDAMVDALDNVYNSLNQVYMAGLMTAPMIVIELVVMRGMYQDKRRNALILGGAIVGCAAASSRVSKPRSIR
jgi:hypothetical protein